MPTQHQPTLGDTLLATSRRVYVRRNVLPVLKVMSKLRIAFCVSSIITIYQSYINSKYRLHPGIGRLWLLKQQRPDDIGLTSSGLGCLAISFVAGTTGFEPAISALTGPHVKPLHHAPERTIVYHNAYRASRFRSMLRFIETVVRSRAVTTRQLLQ